jgi:hypothetical protein
MAKPEFSETQFVFGYLNEMYFRQASNPKLFPVWEYFMFPSTVIERELPVDFYADYYTHSEYYQFKRSDYFARRRGKREIAENIPISFLDYYRFEIYNNTDTKYLGQFEKLAELARSFPNDLICYCAPCFHTELEFHHYFINKTIISNSVVIPCNQFNQPTFQLPHFNINDGMDHFMVFKPGKREGYLCSEPKEIEVVNAVLKGEIVRNQKGENTLQQTINTLYEEFYLADQTNVETQKTYTDRIGERFYIVGNHLLQSYNIVWQPIFIEI